MATGIKKITDSEAKLEGAK